MGWPHGWYGSGVHGGTVVGEEVVRAPGAAELRPRDAPARPANRTATRAMPDAAAMAPAPTTTPGPRPRRRAGGRPSAPSATIEPGGATVVDATRTGVVRVVDAPSGGNGDRS